MFIRYLGTAAAEAWPALFCECDNCKRAMEAGGKNIRKRSQAIIDDKLLIDFPMDTYANLMQAKLNLANVYNCIITHSHEDHLYPKDLMMRGPVFCHLKHNIPFTVYGTDKVKEAILSETGKFVGLEDDKAVNFKEIKPFDTFTVDKYTITALPADHSPATGPVFYMISDGEKTMLYANDTGYFFEEVWEYFEKNNVKFDFVSLDCTCITIECDRGHMGITANLRVAERMKAMGIADDNTVFCIHHFSHNGGMIYDELAPYMAERGMLVSHDNLVVDF